jgi:hypothetical protein
MAKMRRGNYRSRLANLEEQASRACDQSRPRVVVYLPRKDGDIRPLGVCPESGRVLMVLYDRDHPDPPLPDGW